MISFFTKTCSCGTEFSRRKGEKEAAWVMRKNCDNCGQPNWRDQKGYDRRGHRAKK